MPQPLKSRRQMHLAGLALASALALTPTGAQAQSFSIETGSLQGLDAWSVGVRAPDNLPTTLWRGADARGIGPLLERVSPTAASPAGQALIRRVLQSPGPGPGGDDNGAAARLRFDALGRLGAADALAQMGTSLGARGNDPVIGQYLAQAALARGQTEDACRRSSIDPGTEPAVFLFRLRAFCAALAGNLPSSDLALSLGRSAGDTDTWLASVLPLVARTGPAPRTLPTARYDSSLNVAVSLAAGLRPGTDPLARSSTLALVALARADAAPAAARVPAVLELVKRGALDAGSAKALIAAVTAASPAGLSPLAQSVREAHLLGGGQAASQVIADALRRATAAADFQLTARLFAADIARMSPGLDASTSLLMARAALLAGDVGTASAFSAAAQAASAPAASLGPLEVAITAGSRADRGVFEALIAQRIAIASGTAARGIAREVAVLSALSGGANPQARAFLARTPTQGGRTGDAGQVLALTEAAAAGSVGETAVLAGLLLGDGAQTLDTLTLVAVLRALVAVGLDDSARQAATEALVFAAPT